MQFSWTTIYSDFEMYFVDTATPDYFCFFLAILGIFVYSVYVAAILLATIGCRFVVRRTVERPLDDNGNEPGVSILKPLLNVDPLLEENLESHFQLTYPKFELLFCVADERDPALDVVRKLQKKYPKVNTRIFTGATPGVLNPVISNMTPAYENASYNNIWMCTSRIRATSNIITDMANKLQKPNVALVHQIPYTVTSNGFAQRVEKIHFGCVQAKYYIAINMMGDNCVNDMSCMFKKDLLDKLNGLKYYGRYLAEDFFIPQAFHMQGYKLEMSSFPGNQNVSASSLKSWKDRMVRWRRLRLQMLPFVVTMILEPMSGALSMGLYAAWCLYYLFSINPYYYFLIHIAVVVVIDYQLIRYLEAAPLTFSILEFIGSWAAVELGLIVILIESHLSPKTITWGNKIFHMGKGGEIDHMTLAGESKKNGKNS